MMRWTWSDSSSRGSSSRPRRLGNTDRRQRLFDAAPARLKPRREPQRGAKLTRLLIKREPGRIRSDLKEHAAGVPEIDRVEILSIHDRGDIESRLCNLLPPSELILFRNAAERDVMHRAHRDDSGLNLGGAHEVDGGSTLSMPTDVAVTIPFLAAGLKSHGGQELGGALEPGDRERDAVKPSNRVGGGYRPPLPVRPAGPAFLLDQLGLQSIGVVERKDPLAEPLLHGIEVDGLPRQALRPPFEAALRRRERGRRGLPGAAATSGSAGPWEVGEDRPRVPHVVSIVEVVRSRIVEVDGAFDEVESEHDDIEVDVGLRVAGQSGDMVQPLDRFHRHRPRSSPRASG